MALGKNRQTHGVCLFLLAAPCRGALCSLALLHPSPVDEAVQQAKEHHQHLSDGVSLGIEDKRRDAYQRGGQRQIILPVKGHNPQCVEALARSLDVYLPGQKVVFLLGVLADKDYETMLARLLPYGKEFICLTPDSPRALGADELCAYLRAKGAPAVSCDTAAEGVRRALEESGGETPVVAFGSLYLMGEIREAVKSGR